MVPSAPPAVAVSTGHYPARDGVASEEFLIGYPQHAHGPIVENRIPVLWYSYLISLTSTQERKQARWSVAEYIAARRAGQITCEEYAATLIKRARHYRDMNQFMSPACDSD